MSPESFKVGVTTSAILTYTFSNLPSTIDESNFSFSLPVTQPYVDTGLIEVNGNTVSVPLSLAEDALPGDYEGTLKYNALPTETQVPPAVPKFIIHIGASDPGIDLSFTKSTPSTIGLPAASGRNGGTVTLTGTGFNINKILSTATYTLENDSLPAGFSINLKGSNDGTNPSFEYFSNTVTFYYSITTATPAGQINLKISATEAGENTPFATVDTQIDVYAKQVVSAEITSGSLQVGNTSSSINLKVTNLSDKIGLGLTTEGGALMVSNHSIPNIDPSCLSDFTSAVGV
jgi:hypothetical protein